MLILSLHSNPIEDQKEAVGLPDNTGLFVTDVEGVDDDATDLWAIDMDVTLSR